ncbi:MAG: septal ring lytic transglycosylase RlpA family protein [Desulfovibrio sp.]|nr:MAG: septal ring lytic transglycosylase RlpA family protein [Desulfovibrio sp.]
MNACPVFRHIPAVLCLVLIAALVGCGKVSIGSSSPSSSHRTPQATEAPAATYRPYTINGETYYPLNSAQGYSEEGLASWYGRDFHGRQTASGEIYDMYAMTGAHKVLPIGTVVRVTRLDSGQSVDVRINDRGPFVRERIIDLSYSAAEQIGMVRDGTARVRVEVLQSMPGFVADSSGDIPGTFYVQVGSFTREANASNLAANMRQRGYGDSRLQRAEVGGRLFWRVQAGTFPSLSSARTAQKRLENEFPSCFVIAD